MAAVLLLLLLTLVFLGGGFALPKQRHRSGLDMGIDESSSPAFRIAPWEAR